eukprot:1011542-Rhodomonas_salina.4
MTRHLQPPLLHPAALPLRQPSHLGAARRRQERWRGKEERGEGGRILRGGAVHGAADLLAPVLDRLRAPCHPAQPPSSRQPPQPAERARASAPAPSSSTVSSLLTTTFFTCVPQPHTPRHQPSLFRTPTQACAAYNRPLHTPSPSSPL